MSTIEPRASRGKASYTHGPQWAAYNAFILALRNRQSQAANRQEQMQALNDCDGISYVYFLRRGSYIKIGTTRTLPNRLKALRCRRDDVLALIRGGAAEEAQLHRHFRSAQAFGDGLGREHFHPTPELLAHINKLRASSGVGPVSFKQQPLL